MRGSSRPNRVPAGVPAGGQFAAKNQPEPGFYLVDEDQGVAEAWVERRSLSSCIDADDVAQEMRLRRIEKPDADVPPWARAADAGRHNRRAMSGASARDDLIVGQLQAVDGDVDAWRAEYQGSRPISDAKLRSLAAATQIPSAKLPEPPELPDGPAATPSMDALAAAVATFSPRLQETFAACARLFAAGKRVTGEAVARECGDSGDLRSIGKRRLAGLRKALADAGITPSHLVKRKNP